MCAVNVHGKGRQKYVWLCVYLLLARAHREIGKRDRDRIHARKAYTRKQVNGSRFSFVCCFLNFDSLVQPPVAAVAFLFLLLLLVVVVLSLAFKVWLFA